MATEKSRTAIKKPVDNTINSLMGLGSMVHVYNGAGTTLTASCPDLLYGVELEIEDAARWRDWELPGINYHEDGSLRNNGIEAITQPMYLPVLDERLTAFFKLAKLKESNYSERCSVHVHTNCRDLTLDQVSSIALLYQVFEHLFYAYVGADRDKNIFCVPWYETLLNHSIINHLTTKNHNKIRKWQKYTGMNLLPLYELGTLEFRHMAGTCNKDFIINWCNLIGCLFQHAKQNSLEDIKASVIELNSTSAYRTTLERVFRQWADYLKVPAYETLLEEGVLNMKYSLLNPLNVKEELPLDMGWMSADIVPRASGLFRATTAAPIVTFANEPVPTPGSAGDLPDWVIKRV